MAPSPQVFPRLKRDGDPKMIGLWKVGRTIGKGSSGRVRLARHSRTGQYAAVKIVSKTALLNSRMSLTSLGEESERILHGIEREIVIMKLIDHPHIMRLYDVWETSTELYLILEYVEGGELFEHLCEKGRLPASEALGYFQQIITAIDYCHRFHIAHRDLKPENLLLDRDRNIKVADFGMAVWQGKDDMLRTACGSPHYAAPEVIAGDAYDGTASDIWSCGVVLYALLAGRLPFDDDNLGVLLERVKIGKFTMPTDIDPRAQDLIRRMLQKDVKKRITISDIIRHPFYTSQKPKPMKCDVPPLDQIARPLDNITTVDPDIFANLRTLWPGAEEKELLANLLDVNPSWEKGVYHLLVQYRAKRTENYDEDEEKQAAEKRAKKRKAKRAAAIKEREQRLADLPPRTGPPTPSRAANRGSQVSPSSSSTPGPSRTLRTALLHAETPVDDPTLSPVASTVASTAVSPEQHGVFTPQQLPQIRIPHVEDERVQQFMLEIAQHVTAMHGDGTPVRDQGIYDRLFSPLTTYEPLKQRRPKDGDNPFVLPEIARGETPPLRIHRRAKSAADKENTPTARHLAPKYGLDHKPSVRSNTTTASEDTTITATDENASLLRPSAERGGRLRKRLRSAPATPASPTSTLFSEGGASFALASVPKRRWFGALFRARAARFRLLSVHDAAHTHRECRARLEALGVGVAPGGYAPRSGALTLACTADAHHAHLEEGVPGSVKGCRFRVEIGRPSDAHVEAGYGVLVQLVLEAGSTSSMKMIYVRLKREWDLDQLPLEGEEGFSMREVEDERYVEVMIEN